MILLDLFESINGQRPEFSSNGVFRMESHIHRWTDDDENSHRVHWPFSGRCTFVGTELDFVRSLNVRRLRIKGDELNFEKKSIY